MEDFLSGRNIYFEYQKCIFGKNLISVTYMLTNKKIFILSIKINIDKYQNKSYNKPVIF